MKENKKTVTLGHHNHKSAIIGHLFGESSDGTLTIEDFLEFQDE